MRGLPDWGRPLAIGAAGAERRAWAPFETDGAALALPDALTIASAPDGRPAFHLSAFRPLVPMPGRRGYGRLDAELRLVAGGATADGAVRAAPALRGFLRLSSEALSLPAELTTTFALDCSGLGLARLMLPLESEGVAVVERALESGAAPLLAAVDVEVAGVAPRLPGRATVDVARLRRALAGDGLTPAALTDALAAAPETVVVAIEGVPSALLPRDVAEAVADHVRARLCGGPLRPKAGGGLALVLAETGIATGTAVLTLGDAVMATRAIGVALDPDAVARELAAAAGGLAALTTRSTSGLLQSGQHEIVVDASVARPCAGPLALGGRLVCPARPPSRMHEVREDFELPADGAGVARRVRLAPNEPLAWALTGVAYWPTADGRGVEQLVGEAQAGQGARALLRPRDFPLRFVDVEGGAALLAVASVEVALTGGPVRAAATLTAAAPRVALALPRAAPDPALTAVLVSRDGRARRLPLTPRGAADWRIELSDAPGYGARSMDIAVTLPDGVPLRALEVLAEDAASEAEAETYAFTAATPRRTHHWLCRDPFRAGLRWRWRGDPPGAFSEAVVGERLELAPEVAAR
jgi:hypothetical protein